VAGIITEDDLVTWYNKAFTGSFSEDIGDELVVHVREGIESEFQYVGQKLNDFFTERGYDGISNHGDWSV